MMQGSKLAVRVRYGFTLIELLVVVAIIAVLISILLPSLNAARKQARGVKCAANIRQVGQAAQTYLAENRSVFPPSYIYASDGNGGYDMQNQPAGHPYGYLHWSWFLYNRGRVNDGAFTCPEMDHGGHARTNPGPNPANWSSGSQRDQNGSKRDGRPSLEDKQAPFVAFTGNAAVFPRNKFKASDYEGGSPVRLNKLVNESQLGQPGIIILATEFQRKFQPVCTLKDGGGGEQLLSKSHRPINPFVGTEGSSDEYILSEGAAFLYRPPNGPKPYALQKEATIEDRVGVIDGDEFAKTNAIGRHHPGGDKLGGTANFLFVDGHAERMTVLQSLMQRK